MPDDKPSTDFQTLCELADKELTFGTADEKLLRRAYYEAKGVAAHAQQIYWRLRATELREEAHASGSAEHIAEIMANLVTQEKRFRSRKERARWFWAFVCFGAGVGLVIFGFLAIAALRHDGKGAASFVFMSTASLVLLMVAICASRYHTGRN